MNVLVTGMDGFVGNAFRRMFEERGDTVFPASKEQLLTGKWGLEETVEGADIVINLAGESVLRRWSDRKQMEIVESRRVATRNLVKAVNNVCRKPRLWVNASVAGIYHPGVFCDEESVEIGCHFLAGMAKAWEQEVNYLTSVRTVILRLGAVISEEGGIARVLLPMIRSRVVPVLGTGSQELPVIHLKDVIGFVQYAIENEQIEGVYNLAIPNAVSFRDFVKSLSAVRRPVLRVKLPEWLLHLLMGEMATALTRSAHIIPMRMMRSGYELQYGTAREIWREVMN
ncbi:MAG: DUF1731 domain-containing protein [Culturomica sp.]|nr:DUF1731 domain-containing protein [Culturomica sp.]